MNTKQRLITIFEENRGSFLSGEELAEQLGCSRAAVWKAVKSLKSEGYTITAVTNRGYCLDAGSDMISEASVGKYLGAAAEGVSVRVYKEVTSTNTVLRELAEQGAPEGTAVVSGTQTGGKGRLGRSFFSPPDTGLYLSILLRPHMAAFEAVRMTAAAAVAVAGAVEELSGRKAGIKWVNDIYIDGLKICGILTEASFSLENGGLDYAVVGIGVNAYEPEGGFPEELRNIAGAVFRERKAELRSRLAGEIVTRFMEYYHDLSSKQMLEDYRARLLWKGERINAFRGAETTSCTLIDADPDYALRVRLDDGTEQRIQSGEITIRRETQ